MRARVNEKPSNNETIREWNFVDLNSKAQKIELDHRGGEPK